MRERIDMLQLKIVSLHKDPRVLEESLNIQINENESTLDKLLTVEDTSIQNLLKDKVVTELNSVTATVDVSK